MPKTVRLRRTILPWIAWRRSQSELLWTKTEEVSAAATTSNYNIVSKYFVSYTVAIIKDKHLREYCTFFKAIVTFINLQDWVTTVGLINCFHKSIVTDLHELLTNRLFVRLDVFDEQTYEHKFTQTNLEKMYYISNKFRRVNTVCIEETYQLIICSDMTWWQQIKRDT